MFKYNVHHILIADKPKERQEEDEEGFVAQGELKGIVSDRDLRIAIKTPFLFTDMSKMTIETTFDEIMKTISCHKLSDVMTAPVLHVTLDTPIRKAMDKMQQNDVNALAVVKHNSKDLIGIITKNDMMKILYDMLTEKESDVEIKEKIDNRFSRMENV